MEQGQIITSALSSLYLVLASLYSELGMTTEEGKRWHIKKEIDYTKAILRSLEQCHNLV